jgi:hypothetical protein
MSKDPLRSAGSSRKIPAQACRCTRTGQAGGRFEDAIETSQTSWFGFLGLSVFFPFPLFPHQEQVLYILRRDMKGSSDWQIPVYIYRLVS